MKFTAIPRPFIFMHYWQPILPTNEKFRFSKDNIVFTKKQVEKYGTDLHVNPFDTKFSDGTPYTLKTKKENGIKRYFIVVDNFEVAIEINWWNRQKARVMFFQATATAKEKVGLVALGVVLKYALEGLIPVLKYIYKIFFD